MKNEGDREAGKCSKMVQDLAIDVCLLFCLVVVFYLMYFRFLFVKPS
jgi:hypothetical protein